MELTQRELEVFLHRTNFVLRSDFVNRFDPDETLEESFKTLLTESSHLLKKYAETNQLHFQLMFEIVVAKTAEVMRDSNVKKLFAEWKNQLLHNENKYFKSIGALRALAAVGRDEDWLAGQIDRHQEFDPEAWAREDEGNSMSEVSSCSSLNSADNDQFEEEMAKIENEKDKLDPMSWKQGNKEADRLLDYEAFCVDKEKRITKKLDAENKRRRKQLTEFADKSVKMIEFLCSQECGERLKALKADQSKLNEVPEQSSDSEDADDGEDEGEDWHPLEEAALTELFAAYNNVRPTSKKGTFASREPTSSSRPPRTKTPTVAKVDAAGFSEKTFRHAVPTHPVKVGNVPFKKYETQAVKAITLTMATAAEGLNKRSKKKPPLKQLPPTEEMINIALTDQHLHLCCVQRTGSASFADNGGSQDRHQWWHSIPSSWIDYAHQ